ncbi:hypothetical protein Ahy_B01g056302 [Arachis hypogaea]|uniref:Protein TIFY n=1 Tax=Arachis hypogaea TaxID=3818 RepID=A0A445AYI2_ARAHY|nr:hypothetical protein Ahy_B01g056302 [Arachis hypogaea]
MACLKPDELELVGRGEQGSHHAMERIGDANVGSNNNNMADDASMMHFPANWISIHVRPMPASGLNASAPTHFTILFNGNTFVYDGINTEKVQEIMLIAAAYAKSAEVKIGTQSSFTPLIPTSTSSSPAQRNSNNLPSKQSVCFPAEKSSICRLQEFPLARRQSLQRFLEKRRVRLFSKAPYGFSKNMAGLYDDNSPGNIENSFYDDNSPQDFAS